MPNISTTKIKENIPHDSIDIFNEHTCGIIFDISQRTDVFKNNPKAANLFFNKVTPINVDANLEIDYNIDKNLLDGVVVYHLQKYQSIVKDANKSQPLYVMFADCSDPSVIYKMQQEVSSQLFQIGIWTEQQLVDKDGKTPLLDMLKNSMVSFASDKSRQSQIKFPYNIVLSCNYAYQKDDKIKATKLPDLTELNIPSLTVLLSQENSSEVHNIQSKTINNTPVGCIGVMLGILAICDAEYSIGDHSKFNLEKYIPKIELGLGNISASQYTSIDFGKNEFPPVFRNLLVNKGYVFIVDTEGYNGNFFCCDQTLGQGDYNSISRCRICSKVHRLIYNQMLQYINQGFHLYGSNKTIELETLKNDIVTAIQARMGTASGTSGFKQINGIEIKADFDESILKTHKLVVEAIVTQIKDSKNINLYTVLTV